MAKVAFQSPGMTVAEVESSIASILGWDSPSAAQLTIIDQAVTSAGQSACSWLGRSWWFLSSTNSFATVASTASYNLRTVNTAAMADLYAVEGLWLDSATQRLMLITPEQYNQWNQYTPQSGRPTHYAIMGDPPTAYLYPTPSAIYTVNVAYQRRHSKITNAGSTDAALIIPAEFHYGVYVDGAVWLIKNSTTNPMALSQSPYWVETMRNMANSDPSDKYDQHSQERRGSSAIDTDPTIRAVYPDAYPVSI